MQALHGDLSCLFAFSPLAEGIQHSYASQDFALLQDSRPLSCRTNLTAKFGTYQGIIFVAPAIDDLLSKDLVFLGIMGVLSPFNGRSFPCGSIFSMNYLFSNLP